MFLYLKLEETHPDKGREKWFPDRKACTGMETTTVKHSATVSPDGVSNKPPIMATVTVV